MALPQFDTNTEKAFQSLTESLFEFSRMDATPERHIYLLWLITRGVTLLGGERPILVGGGAVEFYTGLRFATGDLDIVAPDKKICEEVLEHLGFRRAGKSRNFVNRSISAIIEVHASKLRNNENTIEVIYRKVPLVIVSPEDSIAERLASYRRHSSTLDLLNAFLITYHQSETLDAERLTERIGRQDLWDFFRPIQDISRALVCSDIGADEAAASLIHYMKKGPKECAF